jgi:hypothetical protein
MKCGACNTLKHTHLNSYGGVMICDRCNFRLNPPTFTVKLLDSKIVDGIKRDITNYKQKISDLQFRLDRNDKVIESGLNELTFIQL